MLLGTAALSLAQETAPKQQGDPKPPEKKEAAKPLPAISKEAKYDYQFEITYILQSLQRFHSPYQGPSSLRARNETDLSHSYTAFLGARLSKQIEVYVNPEAALGGPVAQGVGLASPSNDDILGQPDQSYDPYIARAFVRLRIPMGKSAAQHIADQDFGRAPNIIEGSTSARRIVITAGKMGASDLFDFNSFANAPRSQFLSQAFNNSLAYDWAEDARGYTEGLAVALVQPGGVLRFGTLAMPAHPADGPLRYGGRDHSDQVELQLEPRVARAPKPRGIVRLLAFRNVGEMGRYADALALGGTPDLGQVRKRGTSKSGFGVNMEQALADGGATGIFARYGWCDGGVESFGPAECDRALSFGAQVSGARWRKKEDVAGLALGRADISSVHQRYLAAGGTGLALGDGRLRYGPEWSGEVYYSHELKKSIAVSFHLQRVENPGYNRDRGPVTLFSLRLHLTF